MTSLCIVGAGAAGVGAAYALRTADVEVTILEREASPGGRAATRRNRGCVYDYGANYIKADERTADLLDSLETTGQTTIDRPVWTFEADGDVGPGSGSDAPHVTYEDGISEFAERVLARTDAEVRYETEVTGIRRADESWGVRTTDASSGGRPGTTDASSGGRPGTTHGPFDALLLTPPAPQTVDLLVEASGTAEHNRLATLRSAVANVSFRPIRTLALHYPFRVDRPYYALVNTDREHPVGWLSREECKVGHVPDGECLLIVQMSPEWSAEHAEWTTDQAAETAAEYAADLVGDERLASPDWVDGHHWQHALPNEQVAAGALASGREVGLFVAGDWLVGEGRVPLAFWNGVEEGERIRAFVD